ncbi:hypothetical protein BR93DRAFT_928245 [Coniochaeta sp. PMI_546]|nr:hypothetical protein BR93DRAFT_928245 [Coniochaeta sp. PMI_546]
MTDYWKGRGRTYQSSNRYYPKKSMTAAPLVPSVPSPPLGKLIQSLNKYDLERDARAYTDKASIQDCTVVTSYNWLDKSNPTIVIPGKPPRWMPLPGEIKLAQDSGDYFRDKNGSKYPFHLMESTVLAALSHNPHLPADFDIVACYSSLGNLVRFLLDKDKSFRILVQVVDNTVFFVRRENSPTEKLDGIKGHGHTFPEAYTAWDREVKGSDTSHRILKYRFGGLRMLVRAEADAYIAEKTDGPLPLGSSRSAEKRRASPSTSTTTTADVTHLGQLFAKLNSTRQASPPVTQSATKIDIVDGTGLPVNQSQVLEIKTRGFWKKDKEDTVAEEMPKLWLAQIPNFVVAYHNQGKFEADIQVQDVRPRVDRWEKLAKRELAAFAALLHKVMAVVKERPDKKIELCRIGQGQLEIREQLADAGELLSEEMKGRWKDGRKKSGETVDPLTEKDEQGSELGVGDVGAWDDEKDWTFCSDECGYCGCCRR